LIRFGAFCILSETFLMQRIPWIEQLLPLGIGLAAAVGGYFLALHNTFTIDPAITRAVELEKLTALTTSKLRDDVAVDSKLIEQIEDAESLVRLLESNSDGSTRAEISREMIFARLAVVDPHSAVELLAEDHATLMKFLIEWAVIDPAAVAQRMIADDKRNWLKNIVSALALRDPSKSIELMALWTGDRDNDYFWANVAFAQLYEKDPEQALSLSESLPPKQKVRALAGIATAMARDDAAKAQEWARSITDPEQRLAALGAVAVEMAKTNPEAATAMIKELDERFEWSKPGHTVLLNLVRKDPRMALDWLTSNFAEIKYEKWANTFVGTSLQYFGEEETIRVLASADEEIRGRLFEFISNKAKAYDVARMIEGLGQIESSEIRSELRGWLLPELAEDDFSLAMEHIKSLPADEVDPELWEGLVKSGAAHGYLGNEDFFWEAIANLPDEKQTPLLKSSFLHEAMVDADAANERLDNYREHPGYLDMIGSVARGLTAADTESAKTWIESLDGDSRAAAAEAFAASKMGDGGVPEIYDWLMSLDLPEKTLSAATGWLVHRWAGEDGIGASKFILGMQPSKVRQSAIDGLIWENHRLDPAATLQWVDELQDEDRRGYWRQRIEKFRQQTERIGDR
jgi:hypothetical protein